MNQVRLGTLAGALFLIAACGTPIDNPTVFRATGRPIYFGSPEVPEIRANIHSRVPGANMAPNSPRLTRSM